MKINGKGSSVTPATRVPALRETGDVAKKSPEEAKRTDRVEISESGRAKSDAVQPVAADQPDRLAQIRARLQSGFYETEAVQSAVARRIVASGDHRS